MVVQNAVAVGCVALIPAGNGVYELSKMAVSPELRTRNRSHAAPHAITQARQHGAQSLFLGSSTKLPNAVRRSQHFSPILSATY